MRAALKLLLSNVIDYAGTFPPTDLALEPAFQNYASYLGGSEEVITGRFVCGVDDLAALSTLTLQSPVNEFEVSVIGQSSIDRASWENARLQDAAAMNGFLKDVGAKASITGYEVRVPDHANITGWLRDLGGFGAADVFVELPWGEELADSLAAISDTESLLAKARTGGTTPSAFPIETSIATFLRECSSLELSFKLTAGLHHPLRHTNSEIGGKMYGFLNVLTATTLAIAEDAPVKELVKVLADEDIKSWQFEEKFMSWKGHKLSLEDIEDARSLFLSFGSCSITEPIEDLTQLGLWGSKA